MRRFTAVGLAMAVGLATLLFMSAPASAVPTYSRQYGVTCGTCHTMWGALNGNGVTFRLSGYRAFFGRDLKPTQPNFELAGGNLSLPSTFPISIVSAAGYTLREEKRRAFDASETTRTGSSLELDDISIFISGPIGKHLSVFAEFPMFETRSGEFPRSGPGEANNTARRGGPRGDIQFATEKPTFEVTKFWWNSILPESIAPRDSLNALFGITHLPLGYASGKVRLSVTQYAVYERRPLELISPRRLDTFLTDAENDRLLKYNEPQVLFELNGMLAPFSPVTDTSKKETFWIEYHAGITNGSNDSADPNTEKDIYGRFVMRWYGQSLGGVAYWSRDTYDDQMRRDASIANGGVMSGRQVSNGTRRLGPDATLSLVPFGFPLWLENEILYNHDTNPTGFNKSFTWWGGFHQLNYQPVKRFIAYGRYDWIRGNRYDDTTVGGITRAKPREWDVVLGSQFLVLENMKLTAEYRRRQFEDEASAPRHAKLDENFFTLRASIGF